MMPGKDVVIIDDMIDTGTLTKSAQLFVENGAKTYCCCIHPILSGPAHERIENSVLTELKQIRPLGKLQQKNSKIKVLSVADLFAEV